MVIHSNAKLAEDGGRIVSADAPHGDDGDDRRHRLTTCPNCNASLKAVPLARHCPSCGQGTRLEAPTFKAFVHEFVNHYVAVEGSLWRTLTLLIFAPGVLTMEYLRGRRGRYVLPLRLFLTASFLFFLVFKIINPSDVRIEVNSLRTSQASITADLARCQAQPTTCSSLDQKVLGWASRVSQNPNLVPQLGSKVLAVAPYAVFVLMPVFAGLMTWVYRARRRPYGEHFVFALHVHAFWFLAMLLGHALPDLVGLWLLLPIFVHGVWAMRRVYGGTWGGALARGALVSAAYFGLMALMATLVVAWAVGTT